MTRSCDVLTAVHLSEGLGAGVPSPQAAQHDRPTHPEPTTAMLFDEARCGVRATGPDIRVVQRYRTDWARVKQGVAYVVPSGASVEEEKAERTGELMTRRRELQGETQSAAAGAVAGIGAALARNASEL